MTERPVTAVAVRDDGQVGRGDDPEVAERAHRRRFSARYKLNILTQYEALDGQGRGALLRREGLSPRASASGVGSVTRGRWVGSRRHVVGRR